MPPRRRIRSIGNLQRSIKRALKSTSKRSTTRCSKRNKKPRRRSRKSIQSTAGNILHHDIMPHIDVRSKADIPELMKRIVKGPITVVLVYADWCGHCHTYKPKFNKAVQNKNNSSQTASLNETMVDSFNNELMKLNPNATPLKVSGYPSIETVSSNYGSMKNIPQESLEETLRNAGNLAKESIASPFTNNMKRSSMDTSPMIELSSTMSDVPNASNAPNAPITPMVPNAPNAPMASNVSEYKPSSNPLESLTPLESLKQPIVKKYIGGSLYKKMTESMKPLLFHTVTHHKSHRKRSHKK
jgi:thiol-disulfide isomerase/thioredoxin